MSIGPATAPLANPHVPKPPRPQDPRRPGSFPVAPAPRPEPVKRPVR